MNVCAKRNTFSGRMAGRRPGPIGDHSFGTAAAIDEGGRGGCAQPGGVGGWISGRSPGANDEGVRVSAGDRPLTRHEAPFFRGPDATPYRTPHRTQIRTPTRNGVMSTMIQAAKWCPSLHCTMPDSNPCRKTPKFLVWRSTKIEVGPSWRYPPFQSGQKIEANESSWHLPITQSRHFELG